MLEFGEKLVQEESQLNCVLSLIILTFNRSILDTDLHEVFTSYIGSVVDEGLPVGAHQLAIGDSKDVLEVDLRDFQALSEGDKDVADILARGKLGDVNAELAFCQGPDVEEV